MPPASSTLVVASSVPDTPGPGDPDSAGSTGSEFAPLLRQIRERGLLRRRRGHYAVSLALNLLALAAVWTAVVLVGGSGTWWVLALAVPAAVLSGRTGSSGTTPDTADRGGAPDEPGARALPRQPAARHGSRLVDRQAQQAPRQSQPRRQGPGRRGRRAGLDRAQAVEREGFARFLTKYQAWLFFPMLLLEGLALKVASFRDLARLRRRSARWRAGCWRRTGGVRGAVADRAAARPGARLRGAAPRAVRPAPGCSFAPNHKGWRCREEGARWGHLRRQVLTSRNVRGNPLTDFFLGGLNYQIEHHLFPSMPRPHLRLAQPLVRAHCARLGVPYAEAGAPRLLPAGARRHALGRRAPARTRVSPTHVGPARTPWTRRPIDRQGRRSPVTGAPAVPPRRAACRQRSKVDVRCTARRRP